MAKGGDGQNDLLILSALDLTQGVLLLHPPSKALFSREQNMNVSLIVCGTPIQCRANMTDMCQKPQLLLDLLEPINCPAIQSATLLTLVVALIDTPNNTRAFEGLDGLLTVTSLFKSRSTSREVKLKLVEFLYFYLMPETPSIPWADQRDSVPAMLQRSPSKLAGAFAPDGRRRGAGRRRRRGDPHHAGQAGAAEPPPQQRGGPGEGPAELRAVWGRGVLTLVGSDFSFTLMHCSRGMALLVGFEVRQIPQCVFISRFFAIPRLAMIFRHSVCTT